MAVAIAIAAVATLVVLGGDTDAPSPTARQSAPAVPTYRLDADHATFATTEEVQASAAAVVVGTVHSHDTVAGDSPGNDGAGDPLPAIPHTDYAVEVTKAIKGTPVGGETITVSLTGGATPEGDFVLDGGPILDDGVSALFFLGPPMDGKYYPLAGGAAVAGEQADGSFVLPGEATGQAALPVTEGKLEQVATGKTGTGSLPDTKPPRATLVGSRHRQRLGRAIVISLSCPEEACVVNARGKLHLPKVGGSKAAIYKLPAVTLSLPQGERGKIALRLSRSLRMRIKQALSAHQVVAVEVSLYMLDAARNATKRKYRVTLGE